MKGSRGCVTFRSQSYVYGKVAYRYCPGFLTENIDLMTPPKKRAVNSTSDNKKKVMILGCLFYYYRIGQTPVVFVTIDNI